MVSSASYSGSNNVATTPSRGVALGTCRKRRCMTTSCGNGNDYSLGSRRSSRIASNGYSTALPASPITTVPTSTIPPSLISTVPTRTGPTSSPLSSGSIPVSSTGIPPSSLSGHSATSGLSRSSSAVHSSRPSHQLDAVVGSWARDEPSGTHFVYSKVPGPTSTAVHSSSSAYDIFSRFFTEEVWGLLATETNRYAEQTRSHTPHARPWKETTVPEMKAFIGILIYLGILKLPRLELYWSNIDMHIATPGISQIMPLVRFQQIFRFFHLTNSENAVLHGQPGHDRLFKVRSLLDLVVPKFGEEYTLHQQVSVDEAMIKFKGRLGFKQYMKDKPIKWGMKVFVLADATNGYVSNLQVYTGKGVDSGGTSNVGLCTRVVLDLMDGLHGSGHELYTDNYYTSPTLFLTLYNLGINACGTVRSNRRFFPKELITQCTRHNRGFYEYRSNGPLLASVWIDKRTIYFVSTLHPAEPAGTVKRRRVDGSQEDVSCPPLLVDYQKYMRGVDRGDQLSGYYNIGRRSKKWWKRVFSYLVECCILNSYVLESHVQAASHQVRGSGKRDFLAFRLDLARQLVGSYCSR